MIGLLAVAAVATDVSEARACLPLEHGALVGTAGGLVELADDGAIVRVRTALDGLPGTRIDSIVQLGDKTWIGTDAGGARVTELATPDAFQSHSVRGFAQLGSDDLRRDVGQRRDRRRDRRDGPVAFRGVSRMARACASRRSRRRRR